MCEVAFKPCLSCRVVAEALCFDMPVVMNRHIVGGWKYVNDYTGEFFSDSSDVVDAYRRLRDKASKLAPRDYFRYFAQDCFLSLASSTSH